MKGEEDATRCSRKKPKGSKPVRVKSAAHMKCIYTNAGSMGNKQEQLEVMVQQESYGMITITKTWWDDSHNWSTALDGYKLFRRGWRGRTGGELFI